MRHTSNGESGQGLRKKVDGGGDLGSIIRIFCNVRQCCCIVTENGGNCSVLGAGKPLYVTRKEVV